MANEKKKIANQDVKATVIKQPKLTKAAKQNLQEAIAAVAAAGKKRMIKKDEIAKQKVDKIEKAINKVTSPMLREAATNAVKAIGIPVKPAKKGYAAVVEGRKKEKKPDLYSCATVNGLRRILSQYENTSSSNTISVKDGVIRIHNRNDRVIAVINSLKP